LIIVGILAVFLTIILHPATGVIWFWLGVLLAVAGGFMAVNSSSFDRALKKRLTLEAKNRFRRILVFVTNAETKRVKIRFPNQRYRDLFAKENNIPV
jgi:hypothetical protein